MVQVEEEGFLVVFEDGKHQIKVGSIDMHPTFEFKEYRTMLAEMVGVSHNNLISYFVDYTKHLITSKVDFSAFGDKNGFFLVVLKRPRKDRRRKKANNPLVESFDFRLNHNGKTASQMPVDGDDEKVNIWPQELEMMKKANSKNFKIQKSDEDYLCSFPTSINEELAYPKDERRPKIRASCVSCTKAEQEGKIPPFHFCRYDKILEGVFQSLYGPIARPVKYVCCN